jgi:predicted nucleic acid-binding protein
VISFDTNILVYAADENADARHAAARDILRAARNAPAALTEQSLVEFINAATRKAKLPLARVAPYVREMLATFMLMLPDKSTIEDVLFLLSRHSISVFDARIVAVCNAHGCSHLLSEDLQDGASYGGVTIVNPFNPANAGLVEQLLS